MQRECIDMDLIESRIYIKRVLRKTKDYFFYIKQISDKDCIQGIWMKNVKINELKV